MERVARTVVALSCLVAGLAAAPLPAQDDVTIYRCVDVSGQVSIGNLPCRDGQRQETRSMVRPVDGAPPAARPDPAPTAAEPPPPRVVVAAAPRPLYECVRPDGSTYESETGDGEPRWVPLWTLGDRDAHVPGRGGIGGVYGGPGTPPAGGISAPRASGLSAPPISRISVPPDPPHPASGRVGPPRPRPPHGGHGPHYGYGYDPGTWVRDACHVLPQAETCARLRDRREAIRTRFFNAQQRERDTLRVEERGLNARLANDCGVR